MDNEMNQLSQLQDAISNENALLLYFYSDNCAPCKSLRPKVEELIITTYPKMKLYFINSEKHQDITAKFGVFSNPSLLVFFEGKEYLRKSKYVSIVELEQGIERLYQMMFD